MTAHRSMIRGAGGGGGKGGGGGDTARAPVEAPDSLRSIQYARVLDLLCEGEIGGLVAGAQSVYLDGTPLANPDGTYNFSGVTLSTVNGTQAQSYLPGFPAVESEVPVNVEVTHASSVTRQISNANVNKARVTISVPQITSQNPTTGDLSGSSVTIAIDLQANGGGYVEQTLPDGGVIAGKTTTRYQRSYEITLAGSAPWDIRVRRLTADSTSAALVDDTYWGSYTEIIDTKLTYPNSALCGIEIDASQFNAIPTRAYDAYLALVQIPSNYDPDTREYDGTWDGTFVTDWTDNPAWCFYDLITHERYGLGAYVVASQVDKWALYDIAQYCDELVDDGFGGEEPRFTCNLYLQTREEAYKVLANMASIFRGMTYWSAGAAVPVADKPEDATALYTAANVIGGAFRYQGTARSTRHTVALVSWNDPADGYKLKVEYVEDRTGIERYGVRETEIVAFGCTSRGQAHRLGRWLLYSERMETETVTFGVGLDGQLSPPGAIIKTHDPSRAGARVGGRVISATTSAVTIDSAVTIAPATTYTLSAIAPDGAVVESTVTNTAGSATVLTVSPALSQAPQAHAIWVLSSDDLVPETWRVLAVTEVEKAQFEIVALEHDVNKFAAVEDGLILEPAPTSALTVMPAAPTDLSVTECLFEAGPELASTRAVLSWVGTTGRYAIAYRSSVGNWVNLPEAVSQTINIDNIEPGTYTFSVQQINALGRRSLATALTTEIYGKTLPPADLDGFTVVQSTGFALAQWTLAADVDVRIGGTVVIRHSSLSSGATWNDGMILQTFPGGLIQGLCPLITGTYMAKARDSSGNYSENEVTFVVTEGMITGFTTVGTSTQAAAFSGTKTNLTVSASKLKLSSGSAWDSVAGNIDDVVGLCDSVGGQALTGTYEFAAVLDLTTVAVRRFEADITVLSVDNSDTWDEQDGNIDDVDGLFDGDVINDCNVTLYAAVTDDNPAGSPVWKDWAPFLVADFSCRAAKFKLDFVSGNANHNIEVSTLTVHAKIP